MQFELVEEVTASRSAPGPPPQADSGSVEMLETQGPDTMPTETLRRRMPYVIEYHLLSGQVAHPDCFTVPLLAVRGSLPRMPPPRMRYVPSAHAFGNEIG